MSLLVLFGGASTSTANTYTYQWQDSSDGVSGWVNISGETSNSYVIGAGEASKYLRCQVTATNFRGSATAPSNVLGAVGAAPAISVAPAVTGTARVAQTLSSTTGTWANTPTSYAYQWQRDAHGNSVYSNIASATSSTYVLVDLDDACKIRCVVTATNALGSASSNSNATTAVVEPSPSDSVVPAVTGTTVVGSTLTSSNGTWTGMGGYLPVFTYQWQNSANGSTGWTNLTGQTASTYLIRQIDNPIYIRCVVTATNDAGTATANAVAVGPITGPPASTVPPAVSGDVRMRSVLSCTTGTWTGTPTSYAYQWQVLVDGVWTNVSAYSTSSTWRVSNEAHDTTVRCLVSATNSAGTGSQASNIVGPATGGISLDPHESSSLTLTVHASGSLTLTPR